MHGGNATGDSQQHQLEIHVGEASDSDVAAVHAAARSSELSAALAGDLTDEERRQRVARVMTDHGVTNAVVTVTGDRVRVTVGGAE